MNHKYKELLDWGKSLSLSFLIALFILCFLRLNLVSGESMNPSLEHHDLLLLSPRAYKNKLPERGDTIVFESGIIFKNREKLYIKRVIALEGEHILIEDQKVYINGEKLEENYLDPELTPGSIDMVVPEGHIFAMGDNRSFSRDSRELGPIKLDKIKGRAIFRIFPPTKMKKL